MDPGADGIGRSRCRPAAHPWPLIKAELFEQTIQSRYLGTKRFSLEGEAALLPLLDAILSAAAEYGAEKGMIAMSHRGRLNVMVNIVGRAAAEVFARFEDVDPRSVLGGGDVKYHMGATGDFYAANGRKIEMHLVSNPSHLEAVDPVVMGRTRAKQMRRGRTVAGRSWLSPCTATLRSPARACGLKL